MGSMSVAVMGGASHLKRPWDEAQYNEFDGQSAAPTLMASELNERFPADSLSTVERRLLPISTSAELVAVADNQPRRSSPPSYRGGKSRPLDTSRSGLNSPLKRPRLLEDLEIEATRVDRSGSTTSPADDLVSLLSIILP